MNIVAINILGGRNYYARFREDGGWDEVYDPRVATGFRTKKEANRAVKEKTTMAEYMALADYEKELGDFLLWVEDGMVRRSFPPLSSYNRLYNGESPSEVLDWWIAHGTNDEDEIQYEIYQTWPNLHVVFKHLWNIQSYRDMDDYTKHLSFKVYTRKDGNFSDFKKEIGLVEPYITRFGDEGEKILDIFDHKLSEGGDSAYLLIHPDGEWGIDGRYGEIHSKDGPKEVFETMKRERYYE